jgi:uncharacterized coiled-coil protein SlyX
VDVSGDQRNQNQNSNPNPNPNPNPNQIQDWIMDTELETRVRELENKLRLVEKALQIVLKRWSLTEAATDEAWGSHCVMKTVRNGTGTEYQMMVRTVEERLEVLEDRTKSPDPTDDW